MNKQTFYKLGDPCPGHYGEHDLRGQAIGEFRPPRKGEWYISGAIPAVYRASNDLNTDYHIAHIVRVKTTTVVVERIVEILEGV